MTDLREIKKQLKADLKAVARVKCLRTAMEQEAQALDRELDRLALLWAQGEDVTNWYLNRYAARHENCKAHLDLVARASKALARTCPEGVKNG